MAAFLGARLLGGLLGSGGIGNFVTGAFNMAKKYMRPVANFFANAMSPDSVSERQSWQSKYTRKEGEEASGAGDNRTVLSNAAYTIAPWLA